MSIQITDDSGMPQWKRELLQRRKCQLTASKTCTGTSNGIANNGLISNNATGGDSVSITFRSRQSTADCHTETMVEERLCGASPADADSDSSEELQYGPGIVNKLKCKYLSLALRESRKSRPTVLPLRRATSLDDLLDDNTSTVQNTAVKNDVKRITRALGRGNESLKRARSVETLLRCDRKPVQVTEVGSRESFNEDVVIDERPVPAPRNNTSNLCGVNQNNSNKPRRPAPLLVDTERPPPDTVRSALRIFESTVRRARPLKPVGDVAVKVANYKHIISNAKKPAVLPKPAPTLGVENIATVKPTAKPPVKKQPSAPVVYGFGSNMGLKPPNSPKNTKLIRTPPVSPKKQPMKNIILDTRENDRATSPRNLNVSPVLFRTPSPTSPILLSPTSAPTEGSQSPQSPLIQQTPFPMMNGNSVNGSPTRQIGVIRPMEPQENERQKALEHEKNLKNARESNEINNHINNTGSWGHKKSWHQQTENTMVFNFRNRKDVPDYIENDGLVLKTRRDRPKISNDSGFILLEGVSPNSSSDWDNEDDSGDEDLTDNSRTSPTPATAVGKDRRKGNSGQTDKQDCCDIVFEGAYVIINGKSSLSNGAGGKQSNRSKLRIQFDDASTSTYEYPSEASLLEDSAVTTPVNNSAPSLIGSANLASYTPLKSGLHTSGGFELGVTRTSPLSVDVGSGGPKGDSSLVNSASSTGILLTTEGDVGEECLRPAADDQTVAWSQDQEVDLLF